MDWNDFDWDAASDAVLGTIFIIVTFASAFAIAGGW